MNLYYFIFFLIIIILLYLFICYSRKLYIYNNVDINKYENYSNNLDNYYSDFDITVGNDIIEESENPEYNCNSFYDKNSFCELDFENNICDCKFQKDDLRYIFDSPETCCKRLCNNIPPDKCPITTPYTKAKYYCRNGDKCKEYIGTIENSRISGNYCGNDPLNNQLLLPYATQESCEKTLDVCDKYNVVNRSMHINKGECLKNTNCGFCINDTGNGKCISGTASGPTDLVQYFYCTPQNTDKTFSYTYGDHSAYLLQK
jgi:hypothetical protein